MPSRASGVEALPVTPEIHANIEDPYKSFYQRNR